MRAGELKSVIAQKCAPTANILRCVLFELVHTHAQFFGCSVQCVDVAILDQVHTAKAIVNAWAANIVTQPPLHIADGLEQRDRYVKLLSNLIKRLANSRGRTRSRGLRLPGKIIQLKHHQQQYGCYHEQAIQGDPGQKRAASSTHKNGCLPPNAMIQAICSEENGRSCFDLHISYLHKSGSYLYPLLFRSF